MQRLLNVINRYFPLLVTILVVISLYQLISSHWPQGLADNVIAFIVDHRKSIYILTGIGWVTVLLSWLYFNDRLPSFLQVSLIMDILDRLTDKSAIEEAVNKEDKAKYIDAEALAQQIKQNVIGQDAVCDDMALQIRRRLALSQRGKPIGIFLLAGPPGTGKTYLAKVLSMCLDRELMHFDLSQFAAGTSGLSQLFGMSKGYVGSDSYGKLTSGLRDNPDAIVLLDEIEKAHPDILKSFLTAWNDGFITERSDGKAISTTSAIFVLTTNAATDRLTEIAQSCGDDAEALRVAAVNTLKESHFAPEILNRIDRVFVFKRLQGLDIARVTALEVENMIEGYDLQVADKGIDAQIILQLMENYKKLGDISSSRDLVRAIEEKIADSLIEAKRQGLKSVALLQGENGKVRIKASKS